MALMSIFINCFIPSSSSKSAHVSDYAEGSSKLKSHTSSEKPKSKGSPLVVSHNTEFLRNRQATDLVAT
ncbi:hypothetical protein CR513_31471, partial [Mucuna pruriens]